MKGVVNMEAGMDVRPSEEGDAVGGFSEIMGGKGKERRRGGKDHSMVGLIFPIVIILWGTREGIYERKGLRKKGEWGGEGKRWEKKKGQRKKEEL